MADENSKSARPEPESAAASPDAPPTDNVVDLEAERRTAEIAELKDKLLRAMAETENVRRRADKEKQDSIQYGLTRFARDLLDVADTLERALLSLDAPAREGAGEAVKTVLTGVELTAKQLQSVFERNGVKQINPKGEKFDPNKHQAIAQIPAPGMAENVVIEVAQTGYTIGDRLLRPAMVVVSAVGGASSDSERAGEAQGVDTKV